MRIQLPVYIFIGIFFPAMLAAQTNLVPNPGFEPIEKTSPSRSIATRGVLYSPVVEGWYTPTKGTTDYYNSSRSTFKKGLPVKKARTGQGRVGMVVACKEGDYAEYIQAKLNEPLKNNTTYCITVHYSLDKRCAYYSEYLGVCFTRMPMASAKSNLLYRYGMEEYVALCGGDMQNASKTGWIECTTTYTAFGGEEYITIGNFDPSYAKAVSDRDPAHYPDMDKGLYQRMAYYYIDDVSVVEIQGEPICKPGAELLPANHFVFVVDVSSSMQKEGCLDEMKNTLLQFTDTLGGNDLVSLLVFDLRTKVLLRKVNASDKNRIVSAINSISAGTVTNVDKAITRAYQVLDSAATFNGHNRMVLVSDAKLELSSISRNLVQTHWKENDVRFSMIQFGNNYNKPLEKLALKTGGTYTHARNENVLQSISKQVAKKDADDYTLPLGKKARLLNEALIKKVSP